jgi:sulfide:quinone oxidoreductase
MANLWLMTGERAEPQAGERRLEALTRQGIEVVQAEIQAIEPATMSVETGAGILKGDYLLISLGAEKTPASLPGFAEAALNLYASDGALHIRDALESFRGGRIVVLITRTPFSCPAAPYEAALLIDSALRTRGIRDTSDLSIYTPEDLPMPVAGVHVGEALVEILEARGISFHAERIAMKVDPQKRRVLFELDDAPFDLLIGVPPHKAPAIVSECGLTDASGWIPVDPMTLQTRYPGVFAIGDVTAVRLSNGMFLPKAGVFADAQARVVTQIIASEIEGGAGNPLYDGKGFCYIEVGEGRAAYGGGSFYGLSGPSVSLEPPSERFLREKQDLERNALALLD